MEDRRLKKIDFVVLTWGVLLSAGASFFWDLHILLGAVIGATLAFGNWIGFRYLMQRLLSGKNRVRFAVLLAGKSFAILGIVSLLVLYAPLNMIAFVIGLSSLFLGIFTHSIRLLIAGGEAVYKEDF